MHELLGTILMVCDRDSLPQSSGSSVDIAFSPLQEGSSPSSARLEESMKLVLDRDFVEHDAYSLFCRLMETGRDWYEWRTEAVGVVSQHISLGGHRIQDANP
jgi:TBC1 domain family protein 5